MDRPRRDSGDVAALEEGTRAMELIYTVGTSSRSPDEFISLLHHYGIGQLADVRRFPAGRWSHFNRDDLSTLCREHGIRYSWTGDLLGGFREGGYEAYMETAAFSRGLEELERLARGEVTAISCVERLPWKCHRWLIAGYLSRRGWTVRHIIGEGNVVQHSQLGV